LGIGNLCVYTGNLVSRPTHERGAGVDDGLSVRARRHSYGVTLNRDRFEKIQLILMVLTVCKPVMGRIQYEFLTGMSMKSISPVYSVRLTNPAIQGWNINGMEEKVVVLTHGESSAGLKILRSRLVQKSGKSGQSC
jgi:hypothetical protein